MDTPLYVLSTAASMVESADASCHIHSADMRPLSVSPESRASPPARGVLPTRSEHARNRKCTGTQTSLSGFSTPPYQRPRSRQDDQSARLSRNPPPYEFKHNAATFPQQSRHRYSNQEQCAMETDEPNMPLNLTISSATHQNHSSSVARGTSPPSYCSLEGRPSVITRSAVVSTSGLSDSTPRPPHIGSTAAPGLSSRPAHDASTGEAPSSDPEIEEHFRRSLGTKYQTLLSGRSGPPSPADDRTPTSTNNVSITGDVDEHFAKSLGSTWTALSTKSKHSTSTVNVDDHFAKALGDTWLKLKAQGDPPRGGSTSQHLVTRPFPAAIS